MLARLGVRLGPGGMGEVEEVGLRALDDDLAVAADVAVVGARARHAEDGPRLLRPIHEIGRLQDTHPLPAIDEHPVRALPPEDRRALLGLVRDDRPGDVPLEKVLAVGGVDVGAVRFVLVPHPPAAGRLGMDEGVDDPLRAQGDDTLVFPVDEVAAGVMDDVPVAAPVGRDAPDVGDEHVVGPAVLDEAGRPEGVAPRFELEPLGRPPVGPGQPAVGRRRDADVRAVAPADAVLGVGGVRPAVGVEDPPGPFPVIPDERRVGRAVEDRIAVERRRRRAVRGGRGRRALGPAAGDRGKEKARTTKAPKNGGHDTYFLLFPAAVKY